MKNILFPFALLISSLQFSYGQASTEQALLSKVNPHWKDISLSTSEAFRVSQCKSNRELIQLHLSLVTEHLILTTASLPLSAGSKQKRLAALSELTKYYQNGVFPLNTKYENATPIFVDDAGTRCAVGQLVYKSGHEEIVNKISQKSNLSYVSQLNTEFVELGDWAGVNGFTVDELAWIQPTYGYTCNPTLTFGEVAHVSCHGGSDGGFLPDFAEISALLGAGFLFIIDDQNVFYLDSTDWIPLYDGDCLKAGLYKQNITAVDVLTYEADTIEYFVEILEPDPISITYEVQGELNQCQGSIAMQAAGGTPPYEYILYDEVFDTLSNTNLCAGIYWLEVKDSHQCSIFDSLNLLSSVVNSLEKTFIYTVFPNPTSGKLQLQTNQHYPIDYTIFNVLGEKAGSGRLISTSDQINLTDLVNGTYYVVFEDASKQRSIYQQVVKF